MNTRLTRRGALLGAGIVAAPGLALAQEARDLRIAVQFGITYLPLTVARELRLIEREARAIGLPEPNVSWLQLSGGAATNDALLSGNLEIASAGIPPVVLLWARSRNNLKVHALASLVAAPLWLNTRNPAVQTIRDFGPQDRIALPAVRVSFQAIVLQMAAEQAFGAGQHARLDPLTVTLSHPDATAALIGGRSEVNAHFGNPPFQNQQLEHPGIRRVLSSYDVVGSRHSVTLLYATQRWRDANPRTVLAFRSALSAANAWIVANPREAAELYVRAERSNLSVDFVEALIRHPDHRFSIEPEGVKHFADFQHRTGQVPIRLESWKDLFFPEAHGGAGT
ncbi:ABC transporter substrate-binding protein [Rhodovarius crocodyli]|uniref:ABC transporter substrate-binding protein n=1 Tax=Rhodovarius crocodyli TaxID=1979269 RepID=A0A437M266_9PROT|nr:ABC transporter substrate-binding protein [Rhodovarius crocodyli]RVT91645.1 ABC transporter substrate-binding protein [Rhodovarius crocodyli]